MRGIVATITALSLPGAVAAQSTVGTEAEAVRHDMGYGIACAKVVSASYIDHIQLANIDGVWKIVNVLWVPNPSAPNQ